MPLIKLLRKSYSYSFGAVFLFFLITFSPCQASELAAIDKYIQNGGYALSKNGKITYSENIRTRFIPASTIKLVTSLAALHILGPDFHFQTHLFLDSEQNLIIQGFGDPFLVSEKVEIIARLVAEQGITEIKDIVLDDGAFALESAPDGSRNSRKPYDVMCSALAVNFNTVPLKIYNQAKIQSPEPQTPFLPLMGAIGKELSSGIHRVNIDAFPRQSSLSNSLLYCGQLFQSLLMQHGIAITGSIKHGRVPAQAVPLLSFQASETISELIESCLLSSNNFMANQLYLALGSKKHGFPATWKKAKRVMDDFIVNELHLTAEQITMVEGSGLSEKNRITPEAMMEVLKQFRDHASLIPIKYGTRMKSGTLSKSGVFCYAGYIPNGSPNGSFVIFLNQRYNHRDRILKLLYLQ